MATRCARSTFLIGLRKERPGLDGGVVRDRHDLPAVDAADDGQHAGGRDVAPIGIHLPRRPKAQFEPFRAGIEELVQTFPRRQPSQLLLPLPPSLITSLADRRFLGLEGASCFLKRFRALLRAAVSNHGNETQKGISRQTCFKPGCLD